jgi:uncharacterized protein (TIGR03000 family)
MCRKPPAIRAPFTWALALFLLVTIPTADCRATTEAAAEAEVRVLVPADAAVWFDGEPTEQTGTYRYFWTPPLEPGKVYTYQVEARWMLDGAPFEETQSVDVRAGETTTVKFHTSKRRLRVRVLVAADALVWFDGEATKQKGTERYYFTEPLPPGKDVYYDVRASWSDEGHLVEQTRTALGKPGNLVTVDFTGQGRDGVSPGASGRATLRSYLSRLR